MRRSCLAVLGLLVASSAPAAEASLFLEVRNAGPRRFQHVVEHRAPLARLFPNRQPPALRVTETDAKGRALRDGLGQLDRASGQDAVLRRAGRRRARRDDDRPAARPLGRRVAHLE